MSLRGIDISMHQPNINLGAVDTDFIIMKATEGTGYLDPSFYRHYGEAKKAGKKLGIYHFCRNDLNNSAISEADWFYHIVKPYVNEALMVLDWESKAKHDVGYAKAFLDRFFELSGVKAMIYMSESIVNSYNWSAVANANYGLWVAKYRDYEPDFNYDMNNAGSTPSLTYWNTLAMWQWTSSGRLNGYQGNLDCNIFYGDDLAWDKYVGKSMAVKPDPIPNPQPISVLKVGDLVRPTQNISFEGMRLDEIVLSKIYPIIEVKGQRIVLGAGLNTAFHEHNLSLLQVAQNNQQFKIPTSLIAGTRFYISERASVYGGEAYGMKIPDFILNATTLYTSGGEMNQHGFKWVLAKEIMSWVKVQDCLV